MLRRIFLTIVLLVFASGILLASVWRATAQTDERYQITPVVSPAAVEEESEEATETAERQIEYDLVWPGILPDHFLYPIKMIRDRIWLWLTTDSLKKAELLLHFADKRIWSAQMLVDQGKVELGLTTATKAGKYLERAINQEKLVRSKGQDTAALLEKLSRAVQKHEEVLLGIGEKVGEAGKAAIDSCLEYTRRGYEEVRGRLEE